MGCHTSHVSGEILINPPIPLGTPDYLPFIDTNDTDCELGVMLRLNDEGAAYGTVAPASDDEMSSCHLVEHLQKLLDALGESHAFTGYLEVEGEDNLDVWRLAVVDGRAVRIDPNIVWPEIPGQFDLAQAASATAACMFILSRLGKPILISSTDLRGRVITDEFVPGSVAVWKDHGDEGYSLQITDDWIPTAFTGVIAIHDKPEETVDGT